MESAEAQQRLAGFRVQTHVLFLPAAFALGDGDQVEP